MALSLCRICLVDGASVPLFESIDTKNDILSKLTLCLNEKIEDIDGYPRNICKKCNIDLENVCLFIQKFKDSCIVLQRNLKVKLEQLQFSDDSCNDDRTDIEIETDIKKELSEDEISIEIKELDLKSESEDENHDKCKKNGNLTVRKQNITPKRRPTTKNKIGTNRVASSILEGEFLWIGDTWCIRPATSLPIKKEPTKRIVNQKRVRIQVKKIKKPNPPKLCDICGEIFKTQDKLWLHKRTFHFKKAKKCPHCPRVLSSDYYLNAHIRRLHLPKKDFICQQCGRGFAFKGELTQHNKTVHNKHLMKKKRYTCKICDKEYKCAKSVLIHERSVHTGDRPAICTVCDTSFYHEDYLKEHMRLHTGETPFKCPICGRGYAQRGNMKSHLRIHRRSELSADILSKLRPNYLRLLKQ